MESIRRLDDADRAQLRAFWIERWGGETMIVHGEVIRYDQVHGFIYGDWLGVLTYVLRGRECEITSLDSREENRGIGSQLIRAVLQEAREQHCARLFLVTTNDNLRALGFYQKRGFELAALRRGAVTESRQQKPSIALIGENDIPLRDEIELELTI